jgi:hypothetical protein
VSGVLAVSVHGMVVVGAVPVLRRVPAVLCVHVRRGRTFRDPCGSSRRHGSAVGMANAPGVPGVPGVPGMAGVAPVPGKAAVAGVVCVIFHDSSSRPGPAGMKM